MMRHRSGKFKARPVREVVPLIVSRPAKSAPHLRGAATKRDRWQAKVAATAAMLRAEIDRRCGL